MRCLNEDEKEQYKGDKNIITANLIADTVPEEFPHNGKPITNLTENDILAPGSTLMVLDGSGEIYMMKESNFNPDAVLGYYEFTGERAAGNQSGWKVKYFDEKGNLIDSTSVAYRAEGGYEHTYPYTFHDIKIEQDYWSDYDLRLSVAENSNNTVIFDGVKKYAGDVLLTIYRGTFNDWERAGLLPITLDHSTITQSGAPTDWCKL